MFARPLKRCRNVADLRERARRRLPPALFDFIDGGADDEDTLRRNTAAFEDYELLPRQLGDMSRIDLTTRVLGQELSSPIILSPTGATRLFHHHGERAVVRAAGAAGMLYSLSTTSTTSIEDVAAAATGPIMFQLYAQRDKGLTRELMARAKSAGYNAACVTIDVPVLGNRERDLQNGMTIPPKLTLRSLLGFATHPRWTVNHLTHGRMRLSNIDGRVDMKARQKSATVKAIGARYDPNLSWKEIESIAAEWGGPFAVKGVASTTDALRSVEAGASAVILSNHGGRQLDGVSAPIDLLEETVDVLAGRAEVIVDGGVRRGTHVIKALALGASACMMGRPYLWGLASGGQAGVAHVLDLLNAELSRDMIQMGCPTIEAIDRDHVRRRAGYRGRNG